MATESIEILKGKVDVAKLLDQLNAALSEEWLAYYQYWIAARLVCGPERVDIKNEFIKHSNDELNHASKICDRIIELGGVPVLTPQDWLTHARCLYDRPTSTTSEYFLTVIRAAEACAMRRYQEIAEMTEGNDFITCRLVKDILADEAGHEQDMQDYLDDLATLRNNIKA